VDINVVTELGVVAQSNGHQGHQTKYSEVIAMRLYKEVMCESQDKYSSYTSYTAGDPGYAYQGLDTAELYCNWEFCRVKQERMDRL
jgi:hypothetical protein